jgi:Mn-dependent DtxR family transcriptional regulator
MAIHKSGEDYLEAVMMIHKEKGKVRSSDLVKKMGFSKPSISNAVALLEKDGYLIMNDDKTLELTQKGKDVADKMFERHSFFVKWLESLGVLPEVAEEEGCAIEHNVSDDTFNKIKNAYGNQIKNN